MADYEVHYDETPPEDFDVVAGAEEITRQASIPRWQKIAKKAGMLLIDGALASTFTHEDYDVVHSLPPFPR